MSYRTHVDGYFHVTPPMTAAQVETLSLFAEDRHEGGEFPNYPYCHWVPLEDGSGIQYTENEISSFFFVEWLQYVVEHFLKPWGLTLSGQVEYEGEEASDQGVIYAHDNQVKDVPNQISKPPNPFATT